ncbi:T9SS type A sorting domain-containing protein [Flavobacterium suzhouense]|uniref:T9SS type A sorting domain-containing protein n=1 Tax=Flavobacterium suzhouense TaxID=1529638 RepID=A0ABW5NRB8_9FLAO
MKKLLLMLLFGGIVYAQPNINPPVDISECDAINFLNQTGTNYDGITEFDLSYNSIVMLAGLDASLYTVSYHQTSGGAEEGLYPISAPTNYYSAAATIYARVAEITNPENYVITSFNLIVVPIPNPIPEIPTVYLTDGNGDGIEPIDLTSLDNQVLTGQEWTNLEVSYYVSETLAQMGISYISNPESYVTTSTIIYVRVNATGSACYVIKDITIEVLADEPFMPPPPTGSSEQSFTQGETLADLEVEGQNIQWYDNDGEGMPDFPDGTSQPLPLTTLLVDGETYYASQTINGVESSQRLAVTVNLILGNDDFIFNGLRYYPNPANNVLNIENAVEINSVSIVNALGQKVITKTVNGNAVQIDVTSLSKGIYFVTVNSGSASKTIKIITE